MRARLIVAVLALLAAPALAPAQQRIPTPASVLGFEPGTDRKLPDWGQVLSYFEALDRASPRVAVQTLGRTTLGKPFIAVFIADSQVIAELPRHREVARRLSDPRRRRSSPSSARPVARGRGAPPASEIARRAP